MKLGFGQEEIKGTLAELKLPEHSYYMRRAARALDIVNQDKVHALSDDVFRVDSQFDDKHYHVELNHGNPGCSCPDNRKNPGTLCKHMIAATIYSKQVKSFSIYDDTKNSYLRRGRWIVTDPKARVKYIVYRDGKGNLICPCRKRDCEHKKAIRGYLNNGGGNGSRRKVTTNCGTTEALELQNRLNDNNGSNRNGATEAPFFNIDPSAKPFMESDELDAKQIQTGEGGMVHKLSNGSYCISYLGIQSLADKHGILTETWADSPIEGFVTVKAMRKDTMNVRKSCQPVNGSFEIAEGKARRNACRMLIPLQDLRALEYKARLEREFSWEAAKAKCVELVGTEANVDIIIHELVQAGKLRQDNPSHYDRTEWLIIHKACEKDAQVERDPKSLNRWSYNSAEFIEKCRSAIQAVRDSKQAIEANEQPLEGDNGKRKLLMDSKLRTFLVEANGTRKPISCREICMDYKSEYVSRLRAGIDSGADVSTVEIE